ncbi:MAG: alpha/beta fold hydrolase [Bacteroidota bacterium]
MSKQSIDIIARDRVVIKATRYRSTSFNGKTVLINSEFGVPQERYADFATFLADQGFEVYTYDYRGIGQSQISSVRSIRASIIQWGELDYGAILLRVRQGNPKGKLIIVGHGLGAQLVGFSPKSIWADRFIFVGTWTPYWKIFSGGLRWKKWFYSYLLIPAIGKIWGALPANLIGATENLPYGVALQLAQWGRDDDFLYRAFPDRKKIFDSLKQSSLVYSFEHDEVNNEETLESLYAHYPAVQIQHVHIRAHEVSVKRVDRFVFLMSSPQNSLWKETVDWMNEKEVALKPGWHGKPSSRRLIDFGFGTRTEARQSNKAA